MSRSISPSMEGIFIAILFPQILILLTDQSTMLVVVNKTLFQASVLATLTKSTNGLPSKPVPVPVNPMNSNTLISQIVKGGNYTLEVTRRPGAKKEKPWNILYLE